MGSGLAAGLTVLPFTAFLAPVLIVTETGVLDAPARLGLAAVSGRRLWRRRLVATPTETVWAQVVLGSLTVGMFDYFWRPNTMFEDCKQRYHLVRQLYSNL